MYSIKSFKMAVTEEKGNSDESKNESLIFENCELKFNFSIINIIINIFKKLYRFTTIENLIYTN